MGNIMNKVITRVAPSPSGFLHLGTLRTALLNYLYARANNGKFILRIDDSDQSRGSEDLIQYIFDKLSEFGLDYDSTFRQSERLERYQEIAEKIGSKKSDGSIAIDRGEYEMTLIRESGYPLYNFASTLDDYDSGVTHIIRGVDHISNADKQKSIWSLINKALNTNREFPELIHAGLLLDGKTGKKLSKRDGSGLLEDYKDYSRDALLNWILKLGWSSKDPKFDRNYPILKLQDMMEVFKDGNINQSNTRVFQDKLDFLNKKHLQHDKNTSDI